MDWYTIFNASYPPFMAGLCACPVSLITLATFFQIVYRIVKYQQAFYRFRQQYKAEQEEEEFR